MLSDELGVEMVEQLGSPLYAYDLGEVEARAASLSGLLPPESRLYFSLKANPLPSIGEVLRKAGCGAEVSSPGELAAALEAGFPRQRILYTGPGKSREEVRAAVAAGVGCFSCESFTELGYLAEQSRLAGSPLRVLLRVNPAQAPSARLAMTGVPSQFGFEEEELAERSREVRRAAADLEILGAHVYFGTQVQGAEALLANARAAIEVSERVCGRLGLDCRVINVGGGFPWPFAVTGEGPDLAPLREGLLALARQRERTAAAELWFESGRYLCAAAGSLLTRIVDVKRSKGKRYVIADAGIHHFGGMSGLGRILRPQVSVRIVGKPPSPAQDLYDLVGPLCSPLDTLGSGVALSDPRPGDLLHIPNVGAYGLTASLIHFLSRDPPLEVSYRGNQWTGVHRLRHGHESQHEVKRQWETITTTT